MDYLFGLFYSFRMTLCNTFIASQTKTRIHIGRLKGCFLFKYFSLTYSFCPADPINTFFEVTEIIIDYNAFIGHIIESYGPLPGQ